MSSLSPNCAVVAPVAAVITMLSIVAPLGAMFIDVQFIGSADIAGFDTWNWAEGSPMANREVELATRGAIEELMAAKGYQKVDGKADCYITIHAKADEWFDGGLFKIEALEGDTSKPVWRGKAEGAVNVQSTAKRQKLAVRTVKKMFKKFPDHRVE